MTRRYTIPVEANLRVFASQNRIAAQIYVIEIFAPPISSIRGWGRRPPNADDCPAFVLVIVDANVMTSIPQVFSGSEGFYRMIVPVLVYS
jgi:hypothetical protein